MGKQPSVKIFQCETQYVKVNVLAGKLLICGSYSIISLSSSLFKTETHKPNHHLEPVYQAETFLDRDYCLPQSTGYNYLDPNYFPANR